MFALTNPWGLLALGAIPAIVAIYFFRRRLRPRPVAGLFLWNEEAQLPPSGRTRSRIETPLSLFLEIVAALLLGALVAGAEWRRDEVAPHCVVVLDHSASMRAAGERPADAIRKRCEELGRLDHVRLTVILSGPRPVVAVGPASVARDGLEKLRSWSPQLPHHSFAPAVALAHRFADAGGRIVLVTDRPDLAGPDVEILAVGRPLPNVGITLAERTSGTVTVRVVNHGSESATRTVVVGGRRESISLGPRREIALTWPVAPEEGIVTVELEGEDALDLDNRVLLAPPRKRRVGVRSEFDARTPVGQRIAKAFRSVPDVEDGNDIVIRPGAGSSSRWVLIIGTPAELRTGEALDPMLGPYLADPSSPLMEELDFRGVIWSGAFPVKPGVQPLLSAGDHPLLFEWTPRTWVLNIDPARSNLHKSPAWPMLFHNLVEMRRAEMPGLHRWNLRQGEIATYTTEETVEAKGPDGLPRITVPFRNRVQVLDTWMPGRYSIGSEEFVVNFLDSKESDLTAGSDLAPPRTETVRNEMVTQRTSWPWIGVGASFLALLLVALNLGWLGRRHV